MDSMESIIAAVLQHEQPQPQDIAAAALARRYAREIDQAGDLTKLGPALLSCLEALHLSPRARAAAQRGMKSGARPGAGRLDELRARRARKHDAAAGDAPAP